jgi:hypothetical protein
MKISLALGPRRPLDRATALGCLTTNVTIPGCGSLLAGRVSGYWQFLIAMIGMGMTLYFGLKFIVWYVSNWTHMQQVEPDGAANFHELWLRLRWFLLGVGVFGAGWLWALGSSLGILLEAKKAPPAAPPVMSEQQK